MIWNSEEGQKVLAVAYALQNNLSNAVSTPKWHMEKLVKEKVHRVHNHVECKWVYSLEPIKDIRTPLESLRIVSKGRTPISDDLIAEIKRMRLEGHTVRSIAENLKVGRGTVEKYMR